MMYKSEESRWHNSQEGSELAVAAEETPGIRAQRVYIEFIKEPFPEIITNIKQTAVFDENDRKGVDCVCDVVGGQKLAIDVTFSDNERKKSKMERTRMNPLYILRDANGNPAGERVPRILLCERSEALWLNYQERVDRFGGNLIDAMDEKNRTEQQVKFLQAVVDQAEGLSRGNPEYRAKVEMVIKVFKQEMKRIEAQR